MAASKTLVDPNRLCMGCMKLLERTDLPCPFCGFSLDEYQRGKNCMPPYEIINGKYLVGKVIGIGGFGITYIGWDFYRSKRICIKEYFPRGLAARDTTTSPGTTVSMDIYTVNDKRAQNAYMDGLQSYIREAENLSRFYMMPGIVSVRDFFYENHSAYIIMEYIDGINMKQYAKSYPERKIPPQILFPMLEDVVKALIVVHKEGMIHRDISPDNIMITRDLELKLIDFGAAKDCQAGESDKVFLKHGYAPVEQYDMHGQQGPWTDVYSFCASIYVLLTGKKVPRVHDRIAGQAVADPISLGIPLTPAQNQTVMHGLGIYREERISSMQEIYDGIYQS